MKKYSVIITLVFSFLFIVASSLQAQRLAADLRPFDFHDKYYQANGVIADMLIARKNGADGESVFDHTYDRRYSDVRIIATFSAYDASGAPVFWNYNAGVSKAGFTEDDNGQRAVSLAFAHPLYIFPSTTVKASDRQAALVRMGEAYFEKNVLGISAVYLVEYTDRINTKEGQVALEILAERNGISLDGTPIIRTVKELAALLEQGLVTTTQPSQDEAYRTPFAIAKVIRYPQIGGITPDAFLKFVKKQDGNPLDAEKHFVSLFECYRLGEKCF